jgi:hypothetical protein
MNKINKINKIKIYHFNIVMFDYLFLTTLFTLFVIY